MQSICLLYTAVILSLAGLKYYNQQLSDSHLSAVIICHGTSTASSMAEAVNTLLGRHIFDALDMPLHIPMEKIAETLKNYVEKSCMSSRMIILVDVYKRQWNCGVMLKNSMFRFRD